MDRVLGLLEIRAVDVAGRTFEGIANSAAFDSYETSILPEGAQYKLPLPLFFHSAGKHDHSKPIGSVIASEIRGGMRWIRAHIPTISDDGTPGGRSVKDRVDAAWADIKNGLVRGLSIDFIPLEPRSPRAGSRITRWSWHGLTVTPINSNPDATILAVRSAFSTLAASGEPTDTSPGVSGISPTPRNGKMTIQEQIQQHENSRAAKVAQQNALMEKSGTDGTTLDATQQEQFDTLGRELEAHDGQLVRLRSLKLANDKAATPVNGNSTDKATQSRSGVPVVTMRDTAEPGILFARHVMALAVCKGNKHEAAEYAKRTWGDGADEIYGGLRDGMMTRAAVAPGTTLQATFAAPLVITNYLNDFLTLLRPLTLLGRIPGLRHVPFNVSMPAQTAGGTYKWVGQGKWKPVTNAQYASVTLSFAKASGIIVLTEELVRLSTPSAEAAVRDELVKGAQAFLDVQLVDSTVAAVANVNPASITNGVTGTAAGGTTPAFARSDIAARIAAMVVLGYPVNELVILMSESIGFNLGLALNAVGSPLFPGLNASGGSIIGVPVVTSQAVGNQVIIAHAPSILMADENGVEIDISREASLQLDSAPTDPPDATAVLTSLWQANLVALRV